MCRGSLLAHSSPLPDRSLSRAQTTLSCLPSTWGSSELFPVRGSYLLGGIIFIFPLNRGNSSSSTHMAFGKHQPTELLGSATDSAVSSFSVQLGTQALRSSSGCRDALGLGHAKAVGLLPIASAQHCFKQKDTHVVSWWGSWDKA